MQQVDILSKRSGMPAFLPIFNLPGLAACSHELVPKIVNLWFSVVFASPASLTRPWVASFPSSSFWLDRVGKQAIITRRNGPFALTARRNSLVFKMY